MPYGRRKPRAQDDGPTPAERALDLADTGDARVTSLKPVRNDPSRFTVVVDRTRVGRVTADDLAELRLSIGTPWTPDLARAVISAADRAAALRRALNIIAYRARTKAELARRLARHDHAPETIEHVIASLESRGFIDDEALARRVAESEVARKPAGQRLLEARLRARGIDQATARDAALAATAERDLAADAVDLAERRLRSMPQNLDRQTIKRRLFGALARRGFDPETARYAIEQALTEHTDAAP